MFEGEMTNLEVARAMVDNALSYAKSGDMDTVKNNLEYIEELLKNPNAINQDYDCDNFK